MKRFNTIKTSISLLCILAAPLALAKANEGRLVGAGFAFPAANQSTVVNSSTLSEAGQMSLQGLYEFDDAEANASFVGTSGNLGWGLGYRSITNSNVLDAGLGFNAGGFMLGTNLYSTSEFESADIDITATFDLSNIRLSTGLRSIEGGANRLDFGIGIMVDSLLVSFDIIKSLPWGDVDAYLFDSSLAYNSGKIGFGFGYTFNYTSFLGTSSFNGGDFHADLAYAVSNAFILEGHYNLTPYHSSYGELSAGATFKF